MQVLEKSSTTTTQLRKQFHDVRSQFTLTSNKWFRSGQNDTANFEDFCTRLRERGGLSTIGKKCLIMFITFKCGTGQELCNIANFTLRTVPLKYRAESDDSGVFDSAVCSISSMKRTLEEMRKFTNGLHKHVRAITEKMGSGIDKRKSRDIADARYRKMATM